ncbi:MAG: ABC transporter ATP-binding protein, partial [Erysipelotrichaceae bacterium]|nr:ABC transporter ATP-binding protein [Erysipelotrichaceae bacterium]
MSQNEKRTYSSWELLKRFSPYLFRYKGMLIFDLFCASLTTVCDIVLPRIMHFLTDSAMNDPSVLTVNRILQLAGIYIVLRLTDAIAYYYMSSRGHIMGVYIETDMRSDAFSHLERLSDNFFANNKIGQIMSRISNDLFDITEFSHHFPEEMFIALIKIVVSFAILCRANVLLTVIIFACLPIMVIVSIKLNHRFRVATKAQRVQIGELNSRVEDSLLGNKVVKAFGAEDHELDKFDQGNQKFKEIKISRYYAMANYNMSTRLFDGLMYSLTIIAGGLFLVRQQINAGDLVAYILYVQTL